jgi:hypothetical protein
MLLALWLLLRGYHGLVGDGQIYAFQAMAKLHPELASDLYLQNTSQDQFTIFSYIYAWFIQVLGLERAARFLTLTFTAWFLAAAWSTVRVLVDRHAAWLSGAALLILSCSYGGSHVFQIADEFLTARLPAEAMAATSLAFYLHGRKFAGFAISAATMCVHPLIALPELLLLTCLTVRCGASVMGAILGTLATLIIAISAPRFLSLSRFFRVMDPAWLHVVQERSQFLFLHLWSFRDWSLNARPYFYLAFTALAVQDHRIRKLCFSAALVGAVGLGVAFFASVTSPIAILVQGQTWRWTWIAVFVSVLALPVVLLRISRDEKCGALCAILLISGWSLSPVHGIACVSIAISIWGVRVHIGATQEQYLRGLAIVLGIALVLWISVSSWKTVVSGSAIGTAPMVMDKVIAMNLKVPAILVVALISWCLYSSRSFWLPMLLTVTLFMSIIFLLPAAFRQPHMLGLAADIDEFSDWREAIPLTSTVLVTPARDVGAFVWFTLRRPNYLAVDQSAGVVFSRTTALEVQRRSIVLLPVMEPNWMIFTHLQQRTANNRKSESNDQILTAKKLTQICMDPSLGFVISPQNIGFHAWPHRRAGAWAGWNLYSCRRVLMSIDSAL